MLPSVFCELYLAHMNTFPSLSITKYHFRFISSGARKAEGRPSEASWLFFCHVFLFLVNFSDTVCNFGSELFSYSVVLKGLEKSESRGRFRGGRRRLGGCCFEGERSSSSGLKQPRTKPQLILMGAGRTVLAGREGKKAWKKVFINTFKIDLHYRSHGAIFYSRWKDRKNGVK